MSGEWRTRTLSENSEWETTAYRYDHEQDGPTAVVVGGQHGFELEGIKAAEQLLDFTPDRGALVVIPRLDPSAIAAGTYAGSLGGDMNSLWPTGEDPDHPHVRECWSTIEECNPDVVVDLHSSGGIYGVDGVGQASFATPDGVDAARRVHERLNAEYIVDNYDHKFLFELGNVLSGVDEDLGASVQGKLARKARADLDATAIIFETARVRPTDLETRTQWTLTAARWLLEETVGIATSR